MRRRALDILLQIGFLEGAVQTRGAYERAVHGRSPSVTPDPSGEELLARRLEAALAESVPSLGAFLRDERRARNIRSDALIRRLGVTRAVYRMLEADRISPLRIPAATWRRFLDLWRVPADRFAAMIRRSHQLVLFGPACRAALARYGRTERRRDRTDTVERAMKELYAHPRLRLPEQEERRVEEFLRSVLGP